MKKPSILIICICILFIIALMIMHSQQLSFINNDYNFYIKITFPVIIVLILNLTIFKEINGMKITGIILCVIIISILSLYHYLFEDLIYTTEIKLNKGQSLIVKVQYIMGECSVLFYRKEYFLFMGEFKNSPYIVLNGPTFMDGDYNIEFESDDKIIIRYKSNRLNDNEDLVEYGSVIIPLPLQD